MFLWQPTTAKKTLVLPPPLAGGLNPPPLPLRPPWGSGPWGSTYGPEWDPHGVGALGHIWKKLDLRHPGYLKFEFSN